VGVIKRGFDLVLVLVALPLWLPLLGCVYLFIRCKDGAPVFFRQRRAGRGGRPFEILKFRTMRDTRDAQGRLLPDAERLTGWGRRLRSLSLDELPELIHVIRGEMSLVGPRPLPVVYLERYSPRQARRHACRPGITGWAQVNGRNRVDWDERFEMDVWYVDHQSLWLDIRILAMTLLTVLRRDGIAAENAATMHAFMGPGTSSGQRPPEGAAPGCPDPSRKNG
jgi:lipopolysaccharide/colanic/teichoic acid biosynthesis glycosyltransferase